MLHQISQQDSRATPLRLPFAGAQGALSDAAQSAQDFLPGIAIFSFAEGQSRQVGAEVGVAIGLEATVPQVAGSDGFIAVGEENAEKLESPWRRGLECACVFQPRLCAPLFSDRGEIVGNSDAAIAIAGLRAKTLIENAAQGRRVHSSLFERGGDGGIQCAQRNAEGGVEGQGVIKGAHQEFAIGKGGDGDVAVEDGSAFEPIEEGEEGGAAIGQESWLRCCEGELECFCQLFSETDQGGDRFCCR